MCPSPFADQKKVRTFENGSTVFKWSYSQMMIIYSLSQIITDQNRNKISPLLSEIGSKKHYSWFHLSIAKQ